MATYRSAGNFYEQKKITFGEAVYSGALAGIIAGIVMSMVAMAFAVMMGQEIWAPVKMIAVTVLDDAWLNRPGFHMLPMMVGMMIHFATAIGFGILFALMGGRFSVGRAIGRGIVYGLGIWLVMQFLVLPIINPVMADMPYLPFAIEHMFFGGFLGVYPAFLPPLSKSQANMQRERLAA
ncbi:MAG: DUF1440 domain-containing protein [Candidatus Manganitrophus sp. SA1]|nr:DUF1440 domain-containing protein [Candidatus Manganitrophus morganii]